MPPPPPLQVHFDPTAHVTAEDGAALIALLAAARAANATPTAQITPAAVTFDAFAPFVAPFVTAAKTAPVKKWGFGRLVWGDGTRMVASNIGLFRSK